MKKTIIAIVVVVLILTIGIVEQVEKNRIFDKMLEYTQEISLHLDDEDIDGAKEIFDKLSTYYHENNWHLELLYIHEEFRDIPALLGELEGNLDTANLRECRVRNTILREVLINIDRLLSCDIPSIL